jgi:hypothetical protein
MQSVVGNEVWLDPSEEEAAYSKGTIIISCMPALGTVTSIWQGGQISPPSAIDVSHLTHAPPARSNDWGQDYGEMSESLHRYTCDRSTGSS